MINEKKLLDKLQALEKKHRELASDDEVGYQDGFADGLQQAMNEVVSLLDEERLK